MEIVSWEGMYCDECGKKAREALTYGDWRVCLNCHSEATKIWSKYAEENLNRAIEGLKKAIEESGR